MPPPKENQLGQQIVVNLDLLQRQFRPFKPMDFGNSRFAMPSISCMASPEPSPGAGLDTKSAVGYMLNR